MYTNEFQVVPYGMRATASGLYAGTPGVLHEAYDHNKVMLYVGRASAFPSYSDRGPNLNVRVEMTVAKLRGLHDLPAAIATAFSIDFGNEPSTARAYTVDITDWALGRMAITANLEEGVGGATARATYAITVVGKGST